MDGSGAWASVPGDEGISGEVLSNDWRSQLPPEARHRIVNKIMDMLRRHQSILAPEGLGELKKIAVRFEEKIYSAATNQSDYLRKISLRMLSMEQSIAFNTLPYTPSLAHQILVDPSMEGSSTLASIPVVQGMSKEVSSRDWRSQLQPDARYRIVNKIMDHVKGHVPILAAKGSSELEKIAVRFEEKVYCTATSQSDYLRIISMKMLQLEKKTHGSFVSQNMEDLSMEGSSTLASIPVVQGMSKEVSSRDWRSQLQPDARYRIVNKIMDHVKGHVPILAAEGSSELEKIAVRFEEKVYCTATSQSDYLRIISMKMLELEEKTRCFVSQNMEDVSRYFEQVYQM